MQQGVDNTFNMVSYIMAFLLSLFNYERDNEIN